MSVIERYTAASASAPASDVFDADNFYSMMDGDFASEIGGIDSDFSEADGQFKTKLKGALSKVKDAQANRKEGLDSRLSSKEDATAERIDRRDKRSASRASRKNMRQVAKMQRLDAKKQKAVATVVTKNPEVKTAVDATANGTATPQEEKITDAVIATATEMVEGGYGEAPVMNVNTQTGEVVVTDEAKKAATDTSSKWKGLTTGAKIGIIGGGAFAVGLIIFAIVKASKK